MCVRKCVRACLCAYAYVWSCVCVCVCARSRARVCARARACVCVCVRACVCVCGCNTVCFTHQTKLAKQNQGRKELVFELADYDLPDACMRRLSFGQLMMTAVEL